MKRRITVARNYLDFVFRTLNEVGYEALADDEKEICDAFDHDYLNIIENPITEED